MLSIIKISIRSANYYLELAQEDYYLSGGEPPGHWHGKGASALGLEGHVTRAHFEHLFQGYSPDGKTRLVQNAGQKSGHHKRVPGWDLTFSPPKSVSICWAMAPEHERRAIERAHAEAVQITLSIMEEFAGVTRRGPGGRIHEKGMFCYAMFEHGTSRAQQPQLHTHVICFNLAVRSDGTTGAVRSQALYDYRMAMGYLYASQLATLLQRDLHLPIEKVQGWFEIAGVSAELIDRFSTRRKEIVAYCEREGVSGAVEMEKAAIATRQVKGHIARHSLFQQAQEIGEELGWGQSEILKLIGTGGIKPDRTKEVAQLARSLRTAQSQTPGQLTKWKHLELVAAAVQDSGFTAQEILSAVTQAEPRYAKSKGVNHAEQEKAFAEALTAIWNHAEETQRTNLKQESTLSDREARHKAAQAEAKARADKQGKPGQQHTSREQAKAREQEQTREREAAHEQEKWHGPSSDHSESQRSKKSAKLHPAKRGQKPFAVLKVREETARLGRPKWSIDLKFFGVALQNKRIFPTLHRRNPLGKFKLPALVVTPNRDPFGLKRRVTIPLDRLRSRARRKMTEVIKAVFSAGIEALFMVNVQTDSPGQEGENWNPGLRKRSRPRVAIAQTPSRIWRQLIKDWAGDGLANAEDNPILTATRAKADVLNGIAQKMRQRSGKIGKKGVKVGGCVLHDNDRIIFDAGHRKHGTEPKDLGTVIGVGAKGIAVRLDNGRRVDVELADSPTVSLAYALAHEDSEKLKSPRARVLFEGNDSVREMAAINQHHSRRKLLVYTTQENAAHFASWGFARLRDQFLDEARSERAWEEAWRSKHAEAEKRRAEEDRRREEKRRQEEEHRRQQQEQKREQQSHGNSH